MDKPRMTGEPRWLENRRTRLFRHYRDTGLPGEWEEEWRGTNLRGTGILDLPDSIPDAMESAIRMRGETVPEQWSKGESSLIFSDLLESARKAPDLLRPFLFKAYDRNDQPSLVALNGALTRDGALLHVPENFEDREIRRITFSPDSAEMTSCPHNLIVLREGSRAAFVEEYLSSGGNGTTFSNSVTEVFVATGAQVDLMTLIRESGDTVCSHRAVAHVAEGSVLRWYIGTMGGALSRIDAEVYLEGPGAESHIAGIGIGEGDRQMDHRTVQHHAAGDTRSRIQFGTLLWGNSTSIYRGLIRMESGAIGSDAYQKNDNLVLETGPGAKTIPKLEILTDEVKCSHGSTVGRIRAEDLFYMTSRGIRENRAKALIAEGFIRRTLSDAEDDNRLAGELQEALVTRIRELESAGQSRVERDETVTRQ